MTSIIKNQIIKHLSKFVKNLSPDKINLSTLKGEGDLTNLELDEKILTDLLELPNWLSLKRAWCNRVSIRIPWTKLKSVPICLSLDEVHVSMETTLELRKPSTNARPSYATGGKYGFSDKVVDGITLKVNALIVNLKSPGFEASLQLSRILLESCTPSWKPSELRFTRLTDANSGFVLLFKELQWQTLRLEARSINSSALPPLRLITNQSRCRITIKKRLLDCSILGCRLVLIMDELLWVLTDAQLIAAILFLKSLSHLIESDTLANQRVKAARKLETLPEFRAQQQQQQHRDVQGKGGKNATALNRVVARFDVLETSYHFYSEKIDLHFCDDPGDGRSSHPELVEGGAFQVTFNQLQVDYYPFHWAAESSNRKHWISYEEGPISRWIQQSLDSFMKQLLHFDSPGHTRLSRNPGTTTNAARSHGMSTGPDTILAQLRQLMSSCLVLRLSDLLIYRVSTSKSRQSPKEFLVGDRIRFALPETMPIIHMEWAQFYYPGDVEFPLPQPKCFVQLNPIHISYDGMTIIWLHAFIKGLEKSFKSWNASQTAAVSVPATHIEVRLEALLPRMVFEIPGSINWERPRSLQLQASRIVCSNHRSADCGSRADLAACLERLQDQNRSFSFSNYEGLCFTSAFPAKNGDLPPISEGLVQHATYISPSDPTQPWKRDLLWPKDQCQIWFVHIDPFWADFFSSGAPKSKPLPFIGTVPITAWIHQDGDRTYGLLQGSSLISVQLDRSEYLFLLRLSESLNETSAFLAHQESRFSSVDGNQILIIDTSFPQLDVSIVFPPLAASVIQSVDGESPLADSESINPDTSSLTDLINLGRSIQNLKVHNSHSEHLLSSQAAEQRDSSSSSSITAASPVESTIIKSHSDSFIEMSTGSETTPTGPLTLEDSKVNGMTSTTSAGGTRFVTFATDRPQQQLQSGLNSMKRGIHNFMTTMDAAFKHTNQLTVGSDDVSDSFSIRSDGSSSSSENYVILQGDSDLQDSFALFRTGITSAVSDLEIATEVREDTPTNSDHSSAPATTASSFMSNRTKDLAVVTFHINDLELVLQSENSSSSIRMQAGHLSCSECNAISREEFQSKFSSRSRGWRDVPIEKREKLPDSNAPLRLRLEQKMNFNPNLLSKYSSLKEAITMAVDAVMEMKASNLNLALLLSSVSGLTAFMEDEFLSPTLPLVVSLRNIGCTLTEDRPLVRVGGPPPAPSPPLKIHIDQLDIKRNKAGTISIVVPEQGSAASDGRDSIRDFQLREAALLSKIEQLERENETLKRQGGSVLF